MDPTWPVVDCSRSTPPRTRLSPRLRRQQGTPWRSEKVGSGRSIPGRTRAWRSASSNDRFGRRRRLPGELVRTERPCPCSESPVLSILCDVGGSLAREDKEGGRTNEREDGDPAASEADQLQGPDDRPGDLGGRGSGGGEHRGDSVDRIDQEPAGADQEPAAHRSGQGARAAHRPPAQPSTGPDLSDRKPLRELTGRARPTEKEPAEERRLFPWCPHESALACSLELSIPPRRRTWLDSFRRSRIERPHRDSIALGPRPGRQCHRSAGRSVEPSVEHSGGRSILSAMGETEPICHQPVPGTAERVRTLLGRDAEPPRWALEDSPPKVEQRPEPPLPQCNLGSVAVSSDMETALLAMLAERRWDLIRATAERVTDALRLFPPGLAGRFLEVASLTELVDLVSTTVFTSPEFEQWRRLFTTRPDAEAADEMVELITDADSVTGWTVANVLKRARLNSSQQAQLRTLLNEASDATIRW